LAAVMRPPLDFLAMVDSSLVGLKTLDFEAHYARTARSRLYGLTLRPQAARIAVRPRKTKTPARAGDFFRMVDLTGLEL